MVEACVDNGGLVKYSSDRFGILRNPISSIQHLAQHCTTQGILKLEYSKRPLHGVLGFARSGVQFTQLCNLHNRAIPAVNSIQGLQAAAPECKGQELFIRNVKNFFGNAAWEGWSGFIGMSHQDPAYKYMPMPQNTPK